MKLKVLPKRNQNSNVLNTLVFLFSKVSIQSFNKVIETILYTNNFSNFPTQTKVKSYNKKHQYSLNMHTLYKQ